MACFVVPAAEAIIVTAAYFAAKKKEQKIEAPKLADGEKFSTDTVKISFSKKLSWLLGFLWGGVLLLAFEHILEDLTFYRNMFRRFLLTSKSFRYLSSKHLCMREA